MSEIKSRLFPFLLIYLNVKTVLHSEEKNYIFRHTKNAVINNDRSVLAQTNKRFGQYSNSAEH